MQKGQVGRSELRWLESRYEGDSKDSESKNRRQKVSKLRRQKYKKTDKRRTLNVQDWREGSSETGGRECESGSSGVGQ